jgi:hypothetical protein
MSTLAAAIPRPLFRRLAAILAAAGTALLAACETTSATQTAVTPNIGVYELRVYTAADGKMADLDRRFRDHTVDLFVKHGMMPIGFFHPVVASGAPADNRLFYIMGYRDRADRDRAWTAFAADPEWQKVYRESQVDGSLTSKIESFFLTATDYSPKPNLTPALTPRLFELRTYTTNPGKLENLHSRFRDHTLRIFARHGMTNMLYWRPADGQQAMDNKMVYLLAFPSVGARNAAWTAFSADEEWKKVAADSQKDGTILVSPGGVVSVQLTPTDYSPLR